MFKLTEIWLRDYYGSRGWDQIKQTREWLLRYGKDVPKEKLGLWADFKHLSEYQVNTPSIVDDCLAAVGREFETELEAHLFVNNLRVPNASTAYMAALLEAMPETILELGVGGDSAISTAVFLRHVEKMGDGQLYSVDRNPLGMTLERYKKYKFWQFVQADSVRVLNMFAENELPIGMVFIDTIHSYGHTMEELKVASGITEFMLMDDATFEGNEFDAQPGGVKRAIKEWLDDNPSWHRTDYAGGSVSLLKKEMK